MGTSMSNHRAMGPGRRNHLLLGSWPQVKQQPSTKASVTNEPSNEQPTTEKPSAEEAVTEEPVAKGETSVDEPPSEENPSTSNLTLTITVDEPRTDTKPDLLSLPPEILTMILSYALRGSYESCELDQPRLPPLCYVSRHLRDVSLPIHLWTHDWNITLHGLSTNNSETTFRLDLPSVNQPASAATLDAISDTAPLFRRFRVWGDAHLGSPYLAFSMHRGQPKVEHGSPCVLCGNWPLELIRPERSPADAWMEAWEKWRAAHDRNLVALGELLFRGLEIEGKGFSIVRLTYVVSRVKGNALGLIKDSGRHVSTLKNLHRILFRVEEE